MAQFLRPDSNVTQTSFTGGFADIDETSPSDADFAYGANNTAAVLEVGLSNPSGTPGSGTTTVRYRIAKTNNGTVDGAGNAVTVTAAVYQGGTLIASDTARTATGTWTTYSWTPSMAGVTDWNDLRLRFTTSASGGNPSNRRGGAISWAELEAPDPAAAQTLTATLFTNTQTFFAPTVQTVYTLTAALFTNTQSFPAPTVTRGAVTVSPTLFTNSQTFYSPTVSAAGPAQDLDASLVTNNQSFFAPTVTRGAVTVSPTLLSNTQTFYAPTVSQGAAPTQDLNASLFTNSQSFFAPTVTRGAVTVSPTLLNNTQSFYAPTVSQSGGPQTLTASLFTNDQSFFAPTVSQSGGPQTITASLFTNDQSFFAPSIDAVYTVTASLVTNTQSFFAPSVSQGAPTLLPSLFTNQSEVFLVSVLAMPPPGYTGRPPRWPMDMWTAPRDPRGVYEFARQEMTLRTAGRQPFPDDSVET